MAAPEFRARAMASGIEATVVADTDAAGTRMWGEAQRLLEHLEQRWSRFLDDSDITRLNRADGHAVVVDPATITLVAAMVDAWNTTAGRFDPSVLPILLDAGYRASIDDPRRITTLPATASFATSFTGSFTAMSAMGDILIDEGAGTIQLPRHVALDPGGIGKGLAADLAVARLLELGAAGALVSIGGDLAAHGTPPDGDGWVIAIENPLDASDRTCTFRLDAGGVATSSTRSRRWVHLGETRHHAIDPRHRAQSLTDLAAVTVIARSGWLAEAHATAALLAGSAGVIDHLEHNDLSGVATTSVGRVLATADLDPAASDLVVSGVWFS